MALFIRKNFGFLFIIIFAVIAAIWIYGFSFGDTLYRVFAFDPYQPAEEKSCTIFLEGEVHQIYTLGDDCYVPQDTTLCWGGLIIEAGVTLQIEPNATLQFVKGSGLVVPDGAILLGSGAKIEAVASCL